MRPRRSCVKCVSKHPVTNAVRRGGQGVSRDLAESAREGGREERAAHLGQRLAQQTRCRASRARSCACRRPRCRTRRRRWRRRAGTSRGASRRGGRAAPRRGRGAREGRGRRGSAGVRAYRCQCRHFSAHGVKIPQLLGMALCAPPPRSTACSARESERGQTAESSDAPVAGWPTCPRSPTARSL